MSVSVMCFDDQCFWRTDTGRCSRNCIYVTRFDRCSSFQRKEYGPKRDSPFVSEGVEFVEDDEADFGA